MSNNSNQFKMTNKQTKRFATYLLLFLIALTTLTLVRLMCRRRHESWWFFTNKKDDTTTTVAPNTTTVAPNTTTAAPNLFGPLSLRDVVKFTYSSNVSVYGSSGYDTIRGNAQGRQIILSKTSYTPGFTVSCDIRTELGHSAIILVPKEQYAGGIGDVVEQSGISYGPGVNSQAERSVVRTFGLDGVGTSFISQNNNFRTFQLTYTGSNIIEYRMINPTNGNTTTEGQVLLVSPTGSPFTEFYVGVVVDIKSDGVSGSNAFGSSSESSIYEADFRNFRVSEPGPAQQGVVR